MYTAAATYQDTQVQVRVDAFIKSVYNWMAVGLALTGLVALYVSSSLTLQRIIFGNPIIFFGLIIGEFALVYSLAAKVYRMQASTATALFLFYAALNGATLSSIFLRYTYSSIASTFFICAMTFAAANIYGMVTKKDLTGAGSFFFMGLIGILVASVVNIFLQSSAMQMIISYIGVIVFTGLSAYDAQKLREMAISQPVGLDAAVVRKGAISGALSLYLDFINLFIMMLHIFGIGDD